jgi:FkbM family methyltransferase
MSARTTLFRFGVALVALLALTIIALQLPAGVRVRDTFYTNRHCCDFSMPTAFAVTLREKVGGSQFPSQIGQDKWVLFKMFPGVSDGFFLDVGSADGTFTSNTKALEEHGWKGICIDPFPKNMQGRTCQVFKDVVWSVPGHRVQFHTQGDLGGVAETLGAWKDIAAQAPLVELSTVTLADILERGKAPSFIHFMSLDIEGAELEALRGLPFDKYRFGAMAIEHNDEEPKRTDIIKFLGERGYQRVFTRLQDDFFAPVAR